MDELKAETQALPLSARPLCNSMPHDKFLKVRRVRAEGMYLKTLLMSRNIL